MTPPSSKKPEALSALRPRTESGREVLAQRAHYGSRKYWDSRMLDGILKIEAEAALPAASPALSATVLAKALHADCQMSVTQHMWDAHVVQAAGLLARLAAEQEEPA